VKMFIAKGAIDPQRDRHKKTMRYEHSFLIQCVILKMKSNKCYVHIRANGLLPLPSSSTIRRLLSSSECRFRWNSLALEHIIQELKGKEEHERFAVIMWDEIAITKDLRFDPRTLQWKGIVDYAGECTIMVPDGIADHVLVFVIRPLIGKWIQPFAWFGTKGAAPAVILNELIVKGISCLYDRAGAIVTAAVCDGVSTNKSVMATFGVSGAENGCSITNHPMNDKHQIHWLTDVPHLLKCTRNHMENHRVVQVIVIFIIE